MALFHWVGREALLASAEFTVLAQAISPTDDGALLWDVFMPRKPVPSVKVRTLTQLIPRRFVSDRREWNARGRYIPQDFPGTAELEMIPIEDFFKLGEREIQDIEERLGGRADGMAITEFLSEVGIDFDTRVISLAQANYRRVELDVMRAWATGSITAINPVSGTAYAMSYGMSATRYQTAAPAWTGGAGGTAYQKFIDWMLAGYDAGMQIAGAMMRTSTREAIRTSAPNLAFPVATNITPTLADVENRISDELGTDFRFYTNERTLDPFDDGGVTTTQTKIWPAQTVAVVPAGEAVGFSAFAPVARAGEMSRAVPEARIDRNAVAVFAESANNGRELTVEAQINMMPIPDENRCWVINAGI